MSPQVLILLPVYNGETFLAEQLDSILVQDCQLTILARDDGSRDGSLALLQAYCATHPDRVFLLEGDSENLGAAGSFGLLMERALEKLQERPGTTYVALSDQDDTWHPQRLSRCLEAMQEAEAIAASRPILVHSDLSLVDSRGDQIAPSFMQYQGLDATRRSFTGQLLINTVTGCTVLMNRALLQRALPVPREAMMHDWWLSLVASCFGELIYVDASLVNYRQHQSNTLGAKRYTRPGFNVETLRRLLQPRDRAEEQALLNARAEQAKAFLQRYERELGAAEREAVGQVSALSGKRWWRQRWLQRQLVRTLTR